eukprot:TRINITY_DN10059_c0_g1_i2.p1 TRINITY_DN10059_c0_g1~~TRINITY_DN10059_c0_g1_i2.p1  ORF type:complete len:216 (+),score=40.90 TRINITY_DN10059_c0_g1_i2:85-732(+)
MSETEQPKGEQEAERKIKVILCGDSAVGKSKLVERFLMGHFCPMVQSTHALTWFTYSAERDGEKIKVDFWDTAGQERFNEMHPSYYHGAHSAILVFDVERKPTYKNLEKWLTELRQQRPEIPVLVAANKIDLDMDVVKKEFNFSRKHGLKQHYVSAATGMNVVAMFEAAIDAAISYVKDTNKTDITELALELLGESAFKDAPEEEVKKEEDELEK